MTNAYEHSARMRKAMRLSLYAREQGFASGDLAAMSAEQRNAFAVAAGSRPPSDTTWDSVVGALASLERQAARNADPFAGLVD